MHHDFGAIQQAVQVLHTAHSQQLGEEDELHTPQLREDNNGQPAPGWHRAPLVPLQALQQCHPGHAAGSAQYWQCGQQGHDHVAQDTIGMGTISSRALGTLRQRIPARCCWGGG
jgi:hypothetical protein